MTVYQRLTWDQFWDEAQSPSFTERDLIDLLTPEELTELCETSSVTFMAGNRKKYVLSITVDRETS